MTMTSSSTMTSSELKRSLDLVEIKPGTRFSLAVLQDLLPDVETCLFFGKVYELDAQQLGQLLHQVLRTTLTSALFAESNLHSTDLQSYLVGEFDDYGNWHAGIINPATDGEVVFSPDVPTGEILPQVWEQLEVEVAASIKDVASKLEGVVSMLPGKQGAMVFGSMMKLNKTRPTIGDYRASVSHARQQENLLILDVSGSMTPGTINQIIADVIALSYSANAHLAVVSNTTSYWAPGSYDVDTVLAACEFGGTYYETLAPLFDRDWGVVITVADYDSSLGAKDVIGQQPGRIGQLFDISLVNRPTFLAECVGQLADNVKPLLIGSSQYVLT